MWTMADVKTNLDSFFWSKNHSNYLDVKLNVFKKNDNKEFWLVQDLSMAEADFNQFMQLRNPLVTAADNIAREKTLSPITIPTMSKDMDEQLKLAHKVVDEVDRANRKICVILLHIQLFARRKEEEKSQQFLYVNYKLEEFLYLLDVMNSVYNEVFVKKPLCNVLWKVIALFYSLSFSSIRVWTSWNIGVNRNFFLKLKWKLRLYHVVLRVPKISLEKLTPTVVARHWKDRFQRKNFLPEVDKT